MSFFKMTSPTNTSSEEQQLQVPPLGGGVNALPSFTFGSWNPTEFGMNKPVRGGCHGGGSEAAEKRFRRRIKNRESTARSRARKLAYNIQKQLEIKEVKKGNELLINTIKVISTNAKLKQDGDDKPSLIRSLPGPL